ncbi:hypothetical protein GCM10018790_28720 [Kitasatospora xanthocidica]|uniref:hypothetical protein n=1 Tax=Kitasatospora xanthocidica TaxID=83382 RepID=UPI0016721B9D|nr:hypothetical protein [Kitasatospora xanthocidica]GHF49188.1 hypothetical protein GCM10018790_28720 [Kitasatospora xanthocidica]
MGEFIGELIALFADGFHRRWHVARTRRRLAAGRPVRIPCSARSGPRPEYVNGSLHITPGARAAAFRARGTDRLDLPAGGTFHEPEPDTWHSQDWAATAYLPPGAEQPVHLQVDSRYLPMVHVALADPRSRQVA